MLYLVFSDLTKRTSHIKFAQMLFKMSTTGSVYISQSCSGLLQSMRTYTALKSHMTAYLFTNFLYVGGINYRGKCIHSFP